MRNVETRVDIAMAFEYLNDLEVIADRAEYDDIVFVGKATDVVAEFRAQSSDVPGRKRSCGISMAFLCQFGLYLVQRCL
ncbi:hypothetical protein FHX15_004810 [Rhizobium sp. BK650]|nr:hypothetical protein [Rhizobium sp. BK650]